MLTDEEFRIFTTEQVKRLGVFDAFRFMETPARREYRKFFEAKTRDQSRVTAVMDEAVALDSMPTIADMARLWGYLFPVKVSEPEITEDEQSRRRAFMAEWRRQELEGAEQRRMDFIARMDRPAKPITDSELRELMSQQERKRCIS